MDCRGWQLHACVGGAVLYARNADTPRFVPSGDRCPQLHLLEHRCQQEHKTYKALRLFVCAHVCACGSLRLHALGIGECVCCGGVCEHKDKCVYVLKAVRCMFLSMSVLE